MQLNTLIERIHSRRAVIGIVGLGYVGLPLMLRYTSVGFKVLGIDIDPAEKIQAAGEVGFEATTDFARSSEADALVPHLRPGQVMSLESTTYPGTTEEELLPRVEKTGLKAGTDIFLVYSPEREDPGNKNFSPSNIPKVIGGHTPACLEAGKALYGQAIDILVTVSYNDPHIPALRPSRKYNFSLTGTPLTRETLGRADCILIATDHDAYDYPFILEHASLIVDTRNVFPDPALCCGKVFPA